ncbi:hypothetical protein [Kitasatospora sp. NBC_01246]|uniref:hypothetical protein n=1 Tax=Kitasatospora sp. NBC_01246 TaxID=2903570 RepID=UPI003FA5EC73
MKGAAVGMEVPVAESAQENRRAAVDRSEGFGGRLPGQLFDRVHEMAPQLVAPLVEEEVRACSEIAPREMPPPSARTLRGPWQQLSGWPGPLGCRSPVWFVAESTGRG